MTKILLVDDREDNLLSTETLLEKDGYSFVKANSGRQALKILLTEFDFALILMDVEMPNLSGFETASLIYEREKLRHIPIIFITAHDHDDENIYKGYKAGAVDYIYKPVNRDLLRAKINVFVELYKKTKQLIEQEQKLITINKNFENEIRERKISEEKIKTLNLQLLQNIDKLEIANKGLDRVAFMASHDLQEPLRKIRIFSNLLTSKYENQLGEDGQTYLSRIQASTIRLQDLIRAIMSFSQISVDKQTFQEHNINTLVAEVLKELEDDISKDDIQITVDELPSLPVDYVLIKTLFHNLITNALKYRKPGGNILVKVYADPPSSRDTIENPGVTRYSRIFVEDNGIGFEQKYAEQIFEMFKRLHTQTEYSGTGIGLALCKKIVEQHDGYISAKSTVGIGSTFIISLPARLS